MRERVLRIPLGLKFTEEELRAENTEYHIIAKLNDTLIGVLLLKPVGTNGILKMRQVAVDPEVQGKGIGSEMVKFSEDFARSKNFVRMELHARETAVPFYLREGYILTGQPFTEVGIPHRKMYKELV
ncbi:MAG: GNAT family N-acetyltransferase [Flavobacteriales bacterium]|nr:GNAT family N-acetyltransferase [Flavobacteriales bacterium]